MNSKGLNSNKISESLGIHPSTVGPILKISSKREVFNTIPEVESREWQKWVVIGSTKRENSANSDKKAESTDNAEFFGVEEKDIRSLNSGRT